MLRIHCFVVMLLFAQPVAANGPVDQNCLDDQGKNRCEGIAQAAQRDKYGLAAIETLAKEGTYVRRAMIVDGYGNDILAISFSRQKGKDPFVEIRAPMVAGMKEPKIIGIPISISEWNDVRAKSAYFDRDFAPKSTKEGKADPLSFCLHSWIVTVETADPARLSTNSLPATAIEPEVATKTQSTCDGGFAVKYAFELVDMAYDMIPICQAIDAKSQRNTATTLGSCFLLSGDRAAAGQAQSLIHSIRQAKGIYPKDLIQTERALTRLIVQPHQNAYPKASSNQISQIKRLELVTFLQQGDIYASAFIGIDADHVEIEATQVRPSNDPNGNEWPKRRIRIFASREVEQFRIYAIDAGEFSE